MKNELKKHAYMIMCHNQFELLKKLIKQLDFITNDIYIHIDKKVNVPDGIFDIKTKYSRVYFIKRKNITWGVHTGIC